MSVLSLPRVVPSLKGGGSFHYCGSIAFAVFCMVYVVLCRGCLAIPRFLKSNCCMKRCRFGVSLEKVGSGSSCVTVLNWKLCFVWGNNFSLEIKTISYLHFCLLWLWKGLSASNLRSVIMSHLDCMRTSLGPQVECEWKHDGLTGLCTQPLQHDVRREDASVTSSIYTTALDFHTPGLNQQSLLCITLHISCYEKGNGVSLSIYKKHKA